MFTKGIENVEDESKLTEERVLAILAPFDAEEAYNWGEEHPKYKTIVGKSISKDKSKSIFVSKFRKMSFQSSNQFQINSVVKKWCSTSKQCQ